MSELFFDFQRMNGPTWLYLSFLLMLTVFFRFTRFFSLRNLDLVALFLFVPGLLACVAADRRPVFESPHGENSKEKPPQTDAQRLEFQGYVWLFAAAGYWMLRCLTDLALTRRPRIEPNLNVSGLAVLAVALFGFMLYEVLTKDLGGPSRSRPPNGARSTERQNSGPADANRATPIFMTPVWAMVNGVTDRFQRDGSMAPSELELAVARSTASLCHLFIMAGLFLIGWKHFDSSLYGMGMATLYLLLPMTAINVEKVDHLLPSVFLVWALLCYRMPMLSGGLFGLSLLYIFPVFLLPLWVSYYWRRGAARFAVSAFLMAGLLALVIRWTEPSNSALQLWAASTAWKAWDFRPTPDSLGFWSPATQFFRLPIFVTFLALVSASAIWPRSKNLADLIGLSAAIVLGIQFWYANRGGVYVHWFLPMLILIAFRPNLDSHIPQPGPFRFLGLWPFRFLRRRAT